jgi:lipoic acid synthetase
MLLQSLEVETICRSARCPNLGECYASGTATFLVLGNTCTRSCAFCGVTPGEPAPPRNDEPQRVASATRRMGLRYVVVTSVTRDDLEDGGASHFARTVEAIRAQTPGCAVELLVPDFRGSRESLKEVLRAAPDVLGHNVETVERLHPGTRPGADYRRSLELLETARMRRAGLVTKSALMLGLGETTSEVEQALAHLAAVGCRVVCLGQYLRPSRRNTPVTRYVPPAEFDRLREVALGLGFQQVRAGPLVRSSYLAAETYREIVGR